MKELIKKFEQYQTPFYWYDMELLGNTLRVIKEESSKYGFQVHYAVKANANLKILKKIKEHGFGSDCVSGNEILRSAEAGFASDKIVFAGVGKSDEEINIGLENDIFAFNAESIPELEVIDELAVLKDKAANVALRLNPNLAASTHEYISTGLNENKFGINLMDMDEVLKVLEGLKNIKLCGIHFHIGSQITDMDNFKSLCDKVNGIQDWFESKNIKLEHINVGGGFGIDYENPDKNPIPDFKAYFKVFADNLQLRPYQQLHFELGRSVVAQCGSLVAKVLYVKNGVEKKFAIVDAGITELIRPALYKARHEIHNICSEEVREKYDVVGPICESADFFRKNIMLPTTKRGDLLAIRSVGAYGQVMTSRYNLRRIVEAHYSDDV
ncbi:MAG: diaminopimelate decarboxylase [Chlorobi bacterium]|nr:diaminopimelate decarboxylase [Chlorobiota bacterium]